MYNCTQRYQENDKLLLCEVSFTSFQAVICIEAEFFYFRVSGYNNAHMGRKDTVYEYFFET